MFEGKPPSSKAAQPLEERKEAEPLRPLSWNELITRLAAARDFRASLDGQSTDVDGSFDSRCARRIAAHDSSKRAINLDDLGNGKGPVGISGPAVHRDASGVARN